MDRAVAGAQNRSRWRTGLLPGRRVSRIRREGSFNRSLALGPSRPLNGGMRMNKRRFLSGATFLGMAGLSGAISAPTQQSGARTGSVYNVLDFGAKGDGKTPDSEAIQKALDAAGAVGGTVYFPAGRYPCHDLRIHPHTTVLADPQCGYRGEGGAMLLLDSDEA